MMTMGDQYSMVVAIVLITALAGLAFYWMSLRHEGPIDPDMEEDFFRMRDEIDRLNQRVSKLEGR